MVGGDMYHSEATPRAARLAAGSVVALTTQVCTDRLRSSFAIVHPLGHHAGSAKMCGFCFLTQPLLRPVSPSGATACVACCCSIRTCTKGTGRSKSLRMIPRSSMSRYIDSIDSGRTSSREVERAQKLAEARVKGIRLMCRGGMRGWGTRRTSLCLRRLEETAIGSGHHAESIRDHCT